MISNIKKLTLLLLLTVIGGTTAFAQKAEMWMVDKDHTSVNFTINHFFSEVNGKFNSYEGSFHFDPSNLKGSEFSFTIDVASVDTDNAKRDDHLQSEDFFNAKKFKTIKFASSKIEKVNGNDYIAYGKLTIRDVTKDIKLPFTITGKMEHPMMKGVTILGVSIKTTINRTDYGVGTGDWAATMVVGDKVTISIPMELNAKK